MRCNRCRTVHASDRAPGMLAATNDGAVTLVIEIDEALLSLLVVEVEVEVLRVGVGVGVGIGVGGGVAVYDGYCCSSPSNAAK